MEKVYCKKCKHVRKICVGYAETVEYHCFHEVCFEDRDKDTPFGKGIDNKGDYTSKRIADMYQLNNCNNCQHFELKVNIVKRIAIGIKNMCKGK